MSTTEKIGEWSEWKAADDQVKEICELVKPEAEKKTKMEFTVYVPLNYRRLNLMGATHYEMKVYVGNDLCLFLRVVQIIVPQAKPELQHAVVLPLPSIILH